MTKEVSWATLWEIRMFKFSGFVRLMCAWAVAIASIGCAASPPKSATTRPGALLIDANAAVKLDEQATAQLARKGSKRFHALVLSGGAAHGAWGAGVLNGWNDHSDNPEGTIPEWDLVTGISTG